jgi:hypothetical protein
MNTTFGRSSTRALGLDEARKMYNVANTTNLAFSDFYGKAAASSSLGGLTFHATLSTSACGCAIYEPGVGTCPASPNGTQSNKRLYYYITDTLAVSTQVFGDQLLTSSPTAGYYSDGVDYWQVDTDGYVTTISSCGGGGGGGGGGGPTLYSITLYSGPRSSDACNSGTGVTYYIDNPEWTSATVLYTDSAGTTSATNAYYAGLSAANSNTKYYRQWNGSLFTGSPSYTLCP